LDITFISFKSFPLFFALLFDDTLLTGILMLGPMLPLMLNITIKDIAALRAAGEVGGGTTHWTGVGVGLGCLGNIEARTGFNLLDHLFFSQDSDDLDNNTTTERARRGSSIPISDFLAVVVFDTWEGESVMSARGVTIGAFDLERFGFENGWE